MYKALFPLITSEESKLPFLVKSIGAMENQEHVFRPEGYPDYHWLHCVKGKGKLMISNHEYTISENSGFFFFPGIPHEYYSLAEPWETHWVTFHGYAVLPLLDLIGLREYTVFNVTDVHKLEKLWGDIYKNALSDNTVKGFDCSALLYRFLIEIKSCISTGDAATKSMRYKQLQPVIAFIEKNYHSSFSLEDLADIINISPQHLCRLFKHAFNMRPFAYLTGYRVQKAKELILEPHMPQINEIAKRVGYNDASYFCAIFKEYEGITPVEFRKMHRSG